jgi:ankyrin repeat protein
MPASEHNSADDSELAAFFSKLGGMAEFFGTPSDVNERGLFGDTPLHFAAFWGDLKIGRILLKAGANPNVHGEYGNTPLHEAIGRKNYEFVTLLLEHGASKELRNDDGRTPVDWAKSSDDPRLVQLLS